MQLIPKLVTPPAADILTMAEIKGHLKIFDSHEDTFLERVLRSVTARLDGYYGDLGRCLIDQSWKIELQQWCAPIRLPLTPVSAITHIKYYDTANVQQTWDAANYSLHEDVLGPFIHLTWNVQPPNLYVHRLDNIEIEFVSGYGAAETSIPEPIREAALLWIGDSYEHRESIVTGTIAAQIPQAVERLLSRYNRTGI